jgi:hypothetical protein
VLLLFGTLARGGVKGAPFVQKNEKESPRDIEIKVNIPPGGFPCLFKFLLLAGQVGFYSYNT